MNTWNDPAGGFHPASAPDYLPRARLAELQLKRLRAIVGRAYSRVPFFRNRLEERGLTPDCILRLEDLAKLPFTVKADLRDTYPFGLFASPMEEIVRLHASSGTTGKPIVVAYTEADLEVWSAGDGAGLRLLRPAPRGHHPERLRVRPVHRRARAPTTARRRSGRRSSPSAAATPSGSSW